MTHTTGFEMLGWHTNTEGKPQLILENVKRKGRSSLNHILTNTCVMACGE